jgi:isoleucyl-tRNA synthetase
MPESVHLTDYPEFTEEMARRRDESLEHRMEVAQKVVSLARAIRNEVKIKVRQPLPRLIVASQSASTRQAAMDMADIIREEINVKAIEVTGDIGHLIVKKAKPNFKKLGPRMGKLMKQVAAAIQQMDESTVSRLEEQGEVALTVDGQEVAIYRDDVEILEEKKDPALEVAREGNIAVALDTTITPELEKEGIAREFVNRVQNLRKEAGFEVTDRIEIAVQAPEKVANAIQEMADYIKSETLALDIRFSLDNGEISREISIMGETFPVVLKKKKE